jgi:hypothetical protein
LPTALGYASLLPATQVLRINSREPRVVINPQQEICGHHPANGCVLFLLD